MEEDPDEYQRNVDAENGRNWREFHTDGPNCHWCYDQPAAYVWCPWGTHVCQQCHDLTLAGEEWQVAETMAARITVHGNRFRMDLEGYRQRERARLDRWIENRTHAHKITGEPVRDDRYDVTFDDD